jgi:hypothetical protein
MATISARRRAILDGVERNNDLSCRMSPNPSAPAGTFVPRLAHPRKNGAVREACRGRRENSNASVVWSLIHSGFIAAVLPATVEIFSAKIRASRIVRFEPRRCKSESAFTPMVSWQAVPAPQRPPR